ncbi:hypothetical protein T09_12228 [Trichinella sp. T9]|nr:hypothetical protein T09_12228 [Trichinella sp. T9]
MSRTALLRNHYNEIFRAFGTNAVYSKTIIMKEANDIFSINYCPSCAINFTPHLNTIKLHWRSNFSHAKWALIDGKNTVCFTTNDYTATDKRTPGAAVCLENAGVYNAFRRAAFNLHLS